MNTSHTDLNTAISAFLQQQQHDASPYQHNRTGSRSQVLKLIYPATASLLGETSMEALSQVYASHYPSRHWDINRYGAQFPDLLAAQHANTHSPALPWQAIAALATLEYQLCSLYYADSLSTQQLKAARLEDASEPVEVDFSPLSESMIERLERYHPLMDSVAAELHCSPVWLMRCNFRFITLAIPDEEVTCRSACG
ncbi:MAG: DNA-binding domain-containing protein [Oceanobacter sp.]